MNETKASIAPGMQIVSPLPSNFRVLALQSLIEPDGNIQEIYDIIIIILNLCTYDGDLSV